MASIDTATAKLKWPGYEVTGAGRIAVVQHCNRKVVLCVNQMEAVLAQRNRCGQHCRHMIEPRGGWHLVKQLDVPQPQVYVPGRLGWEDD